MTRRFVVVVDEWTQPEEIWQYYERSIEALVTLDGRVTRGVVTETSTFFGMTLPEARATLTETRAELDRQVSFALLASFEATLRVDFWDRVHRRAKEGPGVEFLALARKWAEHVRLEDILDVWNKHSRPPGKAGAFKELLKLRHWLGHGRYWVPKTKHKADPVEVWRQTERCFRALPGVPSLAAR